MFLCFTILVFSAPSFLLNNLVNAISNSVCADPGWAVLRPCAAYCIGCDSRPDQLAWQIGCGSDKVTPNECYCRPDLFSVATLGLSNCISRSCTIGGWEGDYSSAEHFYTSYCQRAGFTAVTNGPANTVATLTVDPNAATITKVTYVTPTSVLSASNSLSAGVNTTSFRTTTTSRQVIVEITSTLRNLASNGVNGGVGGGNRLSLSDKIALGVGIGIGLPATIAALVTCCFNLGGSRGVT